MKRGTFSFRESDRAFVLSASSAPPPEAQVDAMPTSQ
jgi:hypothetical protein